MVDSGAQQEDGAHGVKRQRLEVPHVTTLERRLDFGCGGAAAACSKPEIGPPASSGMLDRVRSFLPAMQRANAELARAAAARPEDVDIEHIAEGAPHVAMDLACGVLDLRDEAAAARAEAAMQCGHTLHAREGSGGAHRDNSSSDDEEEQGGGADAGDGGSVHVGCESTAAGRKACDGQTQAGAAKHCAKKGVGIEVLDT